MVEREHSDQSDAASLALVRAGAVPLTRSTRAAEAASSLALPADLRLLYDYWLRKRKPGGLPSRSDIDPLELPPHLWPRLMLLDLPREGNTIRIRIRLMGTHIVDAFGRDPTGEFVGKALHANDAYRAYIQDMYESLVASRQPLYSENLFQLGGQYAPMLARRLSLPLAADGRTTDMALVGLIFESPDRLSSYAANLHYFSELVRVHLPAPC